MAELAESEPALPRGAAGPFLRWAGGEARGPVGLRELDAIHRDVDVLAHLLVVPRGRVVRLRGGIAGVLERGAGAGALRGGRGEGSDGARRLLVLENVERRLHGAELLFGAALVGVGGEAHLVPRALDHLELVLEILGAFEGACGVVDAERHEAAADGVAAGSPLLPAAPGLLLLGRHSRTKGGCHVASRESVSSQIHQPEALFEKQQQRDSVRDFF